MNDVLGGSLLLIKVMTRTAVAVLAASCCATVSAQAATVAPVAGGCTFTLTVAEARHFDLPRSRFFSNAEIGDQVRHKGQGAAQYRAQAADLRARISGEADPVRKRNLERDLAVAENGADNAKRHDDLYQACADRVTLSRDLMPQRSVPEKVERQPTIGGLVRLGLSNVIAVLYALVASLPSVGVLGGLREQLLALF